MTVPVHRKIKQILFSLDKDQAGIETPTQFQCQIQSWTLTPPQEDGARIYTQCPDGEFLEDVEPVWSLELAFLSDWTAGGISDFLASNAGKLADFVLEHHPDIPGEHVKWTGVLKLKSPPAGGAARATETQNVTFACIGEPLYARGV